MSPTDRFLATSSEEATRVREIRNEELERTKDGPNGTPRRRKSVHGHVSFVRVALPRSMPIIATKSRNSGIG
jgi:hypothetical protein